MGRMETLKPKNKNLAEQAAAFKSLYPDFKVHNSGWTLKVEGWARPTVRSVIYKFVLVYIIGERPTIHILEPTLELHKDHSKLPHVFTGDSLCLYYSSSEFNGSRLLANTVVQWITLWLYYYESWAVNGKWLGGGVHPVK